MQSKTMDWVDNHIEIKPTKRNKKITGTRLGAILGYNKWNTPFKSWCEITHTYQEPFTDTVYTLAGKTIEPKQIDYMKTAYLMDNLVTPTDMYGSDYFNKTYGDFYPDEKVFGGMWDSLLLDEDGKPSAVLEFKTTKRAEDWLDGVPEYYSLQAALYAYLLSVDDVIMVCSFLQPNDYEHPEDFVLTPDNTITNPFKLSEKYPTFEADYINPALKWWKNHVETGISPDYTDQDKDIISELKKSFLNPDSDIEDLLAKADKLKQEVDVAQSLIKDKEKELKSLKGMIQNYITNNLEEDKNKGILESSNYIWTVSKSTSDKLDTDALTQAHPNLVSQFTYPTTSFRFSVKGK